MAAIGRSFSQDPQGFPLVEVLKRVNHIPGEEIASLKNSILRETVLKVQEIAAEWIAYSVDGDVPIEQKSYLNAHWQEISPDAKISAVSWIFGHSKETPLEKTFLGPTCEAIWHLHARPQGDARYGEHPMLST